MRYERTHSSAAPLTPNLLSKRLIKFEWHTVSKAALKSSIISNVTCCLSMPISRSFFTFSSAVSVLWCSLYADCRSRSRPWSITCCVSWYAAALSDSLEAKQRLLIGRKFLYATSKPDFFTTGRRSVSFQASAK